MKRRQFLSAAAAPLNALADGAPGQLRIGLTAVILADQAAFLARWSAYLGQALGRPVRFVARESYQSILELLFAEQLDAAWICGYPFVLNEARLRLVAVPLYQGAPFYQSYLIGSRRKASALHGWVDLKGRVFAYSDPLSNSGWLVAQQQLAIAGLAATDLKRAFFAHGHRNVAEAVGAGLADAGSIDGYVWETMRAQAIPVVAQTEVLWKSELHGFPPLVTLANGRAQGMAPLQRALLGMSADPRGRDLLAALNLGGFTVGDSKLYDSIRALIKWERGAGAG